MRKTIGSHCGAFKVLLCAALLSGAACGRAWAFDTLERQAAADSAVYPVYFKVSADNIDPVLEGNERSLQAALSRIDSLGSGLRRICVLGTASPEGPSSLNVYLSKARARVAMDYLRKTLPDLPDSLFEMKFIDEDWDGDARLLEASEKDYRFEALDIIENTPRFTVQNGQTVELRKSKMMGLRGGYVWRELIREYHPGLRRAIILVFSEKAAQAEAGISDFVKSECQLSAPSLSALQDECLSLAPKTAPIQFRDHYTVALKTNLLYDAVTALNCAVEFPIGEKFSVQWEDTFPWWTWGPNNNKYAFQIWEMGPEARWWFARSDKRKYLSGHYVGLYAASAKYDLQWDTDLCYQGEYWSAGLTYGFSKPLGKWLNMEFSVSAGYLTSDYRHYNPDDSYEHLYRDYYHTGKYTWIGPTKARISLVMPLNFKYKVK